MRFKKFSWIALLTLAGASFCNQCLASTLNQVWLNEQTLASWDRLLPNISPEGSARGVVIASPSRERPNYYYHWVRDAALVMSEVMSRLDQASGDERDALNAKMTKYVWFSRENQLTPNRSGGLGEPKFQTNGKAFDDEWGRPQNDGPALRAITLIRYAYYLLSMGEVSWVKTALYDGTLPTHSTIKSDLEYVSHHWRDPSFDLWEEVSGDHFYTRLVQRRALIEGAVLARVLGDYGAAAWYDIQVSELTKTIEGFWNPDRGAITVTLNPAELAFKPSELDVAIVLAALHSEGSDDFFSVADERVLATAERLEGKFRQLYPLNAVKTLGTAIGRYPEDRYDGYHVDQNTKGNPWILSTTAYAELCFRLASRWIKKGEVRITAVNLPFFQSMRGNVRIGVLTDDTPGFREWVFRVMARGDAYLERVQRHTPADHSLSEQLNREQGAPQGARDLSWSYASFLTAIRARQDALRDWAVMRVGPAYGLTPVSLQ